MRAAGDRGIRRFLDVKGSAIITTVLRRITALPIILIVAPVLFAQPQAEIHEEYRTWLGKQPADIRQSADILARYGSSLRGRGIPPSEIEERLRLISAQQRRLETERWNQILTADEPTFNTQPNAFLVPGDFEHGVNAAVNKLRQALGDAANQPHYVETLPGRGYRFVAPTNTVRRSALELVRDRRNIGTSAAAVTARIPATARRGGRAARGSSPAAPG